MKSPKGKTGSAKAADDLRHAQPLYGKIRDILHGAIHQGSLEEGVLLLEGHVADLLGTTRTPVRQALRLLEEEGLVSRFEGRGYIVGPPGILVRRPVLTPAMLGIAGNTEPARKTFAWEDIYEAVERSLIQLSVLGRYRLNEVELARAYGVGRMVARDVLLRLEGLGIVEKDERMRWSVVPLDEERVTHLYDMRKLLEPAALLEAAPRLPPGDLQGMIDALEESLRLYPAVESQAMDAHENDLHVTALSFGPNKELLGALRRTRSVLIVSKHVLGVELKLPAQEPFLQEHLNILRALSNGKNEAASGLLTQHITLSLPKVLERMAVFKAGYNPRELSYIA